MTSWDIALLVAVAWTILVGVWVVFSRPTGHRIVLYARRFMRANPQASEGDLREALRQRFLGGSPPIGPGPSRVAEGIRDRWLPLDREGIARRIEAATKMVLAQDAGHAAGPNAAAEHPRE